MRDGVLVLGEVLCDLFPSAPGISLCDANELRPLLGGAPANVAVQLARLGVRCALVSAVGDDAIGTRVVRELVAEGVDASRVVRRKGFRTGVTLVEVDSDGERRFYPLADRRADLSLCPNDVDTTFVNSFAAVHMGTVGLREATPRAAARKLVDAARAADILVSVDVNLRPGMYRSRADMLQRARAAVKRAHIVKATADEARALLATRASTTPRALARAFFERLAARSTGLLLLTLDVGGALAVTRQHAVLVPAPRVTVIDATGAGDAFAGACLARLTSLGARPGTLATFDERTLADIAERACAAGAAACTALGATTAMLRAPAQPGRPVARP